VTGEDGECGFTVALAAEHARSQAVGEGEQPGGARLRVQRGVDLAGLLRCAQLPGE
jgi:hypothetical protein